MRLVRLSDVSIRTKLFLLLLILVVVPFLIYTAVIVGQVSAQMEALGFHTAEQVLKQTASFVESRVDLVKRTLDLITLNSRVRELSAVDPAPYNSDPGLWIRDAGELQQIEDSAAQNNPEIRSIVLYMVGGLGASLSRGESPQFLFLGEAGRPWEPKLDPGANSPQWFVPADGFEYAVDGDLHAFRRIPDDQNLPATVGWARVDLKVRGIEEILDEGAFSPATVVFLVNSQGQIVARSEQAKRRNDESWAPLTEKSPGEWPSLSAAGSTYRVGRLSVGRTDWTLITAIPVSDIGAFSEQARVLLLIVLALILLLLVPVSFWAASSSTRRLSLLLTGVRRLGEGRFDIELPEDARDEIGELTRGFNWMVGRIGELVDAQYQLGLEVKHRELQALQAQINPHFLHNTLDLVSGLARMDRQPKIIETVGALSRFYRLALAGGADVIPLKQEVEHAATYLQIQNLRFDGAVDLKVKLDPATADLPILKMVLQPLVENAVLHGIREKPDERGTIEIRTVLESSEEGTRLRVEVEDDGVGIEPATLKRLLSEERPAATQDHGYALFNTDRRLRLQYGDESGLVIESQPGHWTRVSFRICLK
jgi:two-component system sensor histidine kinase YesM